MTNTVVSYTYACVHQFNIDIIHVSCAKMLIDVEAALV